MAEICNEMHTSAVTDGLYRFLKRATFRKTPKGISQG